MSADVSSPAGEPSAPRWEERRTEHITLQFEPTSYASQIADTLADRAENAWQRGLELFGSDQRPPSVLVFLAGWIDEAAAPSWVRRAGGLLATDRDVVWLFVSPEQPAVGLEHLILEVLARQSLDGAESERPATPDIDGAARHGADSARRSLRPHASIVLGALGSSIAAQLRIGLSQDDIDRDAYQRHVKDRVAPRLFDVRDATGASAIDSTEVSFLAFLDRAFGRASLGRFVRACLSSPPPDACHIAFGRPLADLQAEWLAALRQQRQVASSGQDVLRKALPLFRPYWRRNLELLAYMILDLAFALAIPLSTKYLFDEVIVPRDYDRLWVWTAVILATFLIGSLASYRRTVVAGLIGELVLRDLRRALFAQLQRLSIRFYARSTSGDLVARFTSDLDNVQESIGVSVPELAFHVVSLVIGTVVLLSLNVQLGLVVLLIGMPVFGGVYTAASRRFRLTSRDLANRIGAMSSYVQEHLTAQMVVKSYGLEARATHEIERHLALLFEASMRFIRLGAIVSGSTSLILLGIRVIVLALGALFVMNGDMSLGDLVAFTGLIAQVVQPVQAISGLYRTLQQATGSFDRVQELMHEIPDVIEDPRAVDLPRLDHEIRLEHVTFRYGEGESGLRDVSMTIAAGSRVAVVGPSGAGKSTLIGLLLRLYDPNEGRVLFDGRDIREGTLRSVRGQQALVPQDTFLFNSTIGENIALARDGATGEQVRQAAQAAAVHEVIEQTEHGYATEVGERGVRLSGGQRQRLAIARALLRDPRMLILDEATSALDPGTEAAIAETLRNVGHGRTTIAITHRLTSVVDYDRIFVLDRGRLVEQGTHQELCERQGLYWRLFQRQVAGAGEAVPVTIEPRLLAPVPLLASLTLPELTALAARVSVERYPAGVDVVRQGDPADKLYVIVEGEVEVLWSDEHGESRRVNVLGPRSYFGEIALLRDVSDRGGGATQRTATVRTRSPAELFSMHREDFVGLLEQQPHLAEVVSRLARIRAAHTRQILSAGG